ncbi:MAG: RNA polymerase sigma factor [Candidatus Aminicenantales bacterium]
MNQNDQNGKKDEELEAILANFSRMIKIHIQKFDPQKYGFDPEDIVQEIKMKIWKILHHEKDIKNYPSYIKKIVNSSVIDMFRKWKRDEATFYVERQRTVSEIKKNYRAYADGEDGLKEIVAEAIQALIESRRRVVRLYLLGMNIEEISVYYGWSRDKTRNLLYRGLADLKKILKKKEIYYENK